MEMPDPKQLEAASQLVSAVNASIWVVYLLFAVIGVFLIFIILQFFRFLRESKNKSETERLLQECNTTLLQVHQALGNVNSTMIHSTNTLNRLIAAARR